MKNINGSKSMRNVEDRRIDWDGKSRSNFQFNVKQLLKKRWGKHVVYEEFPVFGTRYTLDFYNATKDIAIEVQGNHHTQYVKGFFHKGEQDFLHQIQKDIEKRRFCELNGIKLVEIFEDEQKNMDQQFLDKLGAFEHEYVD